MKKLALVAAMLVASSATQAQSEGDWTGFYVGGHVGQSDPSGSGGQFRFDNDLDGDFGDTINTAAGANAFSPGFCGGAANTAQPSGGCEGDDGGTDYGLRLGYDWQIGGLVFGVLGEYAMPDAEDSVSAFSTTPAFYTFTRELDSTAAIRARLGVAFGSDGGWLAYGTGGWVRAEFDNDFSTSNGANAFALRGDSDADGYQAGLGIERRFNDFSIGVEYLYTEVDDDSTRVDVTRGTAAATNPFVLVNPDGTTLRRSDAEFKMDSLRLVASWHF